MNFKAPFKRKSGLISLFILPSLYLSANESNVSHNSSSYLSSFFMQYHPQNAYDMIDRLPVFRLMVAQMNVVLAVMLEMY